MARHAGYGIVASLQHPVINGMLANQFDNAGPFYFPLPTSVPVGGSTVTLGGVADIAAPTVELHPNPGDNVIVHYAFFSTLRSAVDGGAATTRRVRLDGTATLPFLLGPVNGRILLQVNPANVTLSPLTVTTLSGPALPPPVLAALQSQQLANAANNALHQLPMFTLRDLGPAQLVRTQPGSFKESHFSVFDWFTVRLTVSNVTHRVFEGAVTAAVDFAGITQGDRNQLVDLTHSHGGGMIYTWTIGPDYDPTSIPILVARQHKLPSSALLVNIGVLTNVTLNQVTPQVDGTPLTKESKLRRVICEFSHFEKPLRGWEDALLLRSFAVSHGIGLEAFAYLQPTVRLYEGPSSDAQKAYPPTWRLMVGYVEVPTPLWLDAAVVFLRFLSIIVVDALLSLAELVVPAAASTVDKWIEDVHDAFVKGDPENIANTAQKGLAGAVADVGFPADASFISMTPDGIDIGFGVGGDVATQLPTEPSFDASISPKTWSVYNRKAIITNVKLGPRADKLKRDALMANWVVRRTDTNEVVVTGAKPYNNGVDNGVSIPHHSQALYRVGEYTVQCSLTLSLASQAAEIWSNSVPLTIEDDLDYWASGSNEHGVFHYGLPLIRGKARQQPFVEWGPRTVHFPSAWLQQQLGPNADRILRGKTNDQIAEYAAAARAAGQDFYWDRISRSRIHRTAVAARCKMLRQVSNIYHADRFFGLRFRDYLPFTWDNIAQHRTELCDYCFWGGPDKTAAFPAYDWFEPDDFIKPDGFEKHHFG
ncbi:MAG TPA: hypothetical protein VFU35_08200 [Jatrophihabitans sp.]|nr:hypothetical protein [Jatrophihabitans sp.]